MGLGDIADKGKEEAKDRLKEEKADDTAEKLGLEDKEQLENTSKSVERHRSAILQIGKRLDDIQRDIDIIKKALSTTLHEVEQLKGEKDKADWFIEEEEDEEEEEGLPWQ